MTLAFWILFSLTMFAVGYLFGVMDTKSTTSMSQLSEFRPVQHIEPVKWVNKN